jgi:TPR repeat protein
MSCLFCRWLCSLCAEIDKEFWRRANDWDYETAKASDLAILARDPLKDQVEQAFAVGREGSQARFDALKALAEQGSVYCMFPIATYYLHGVGVALDAEKAEYWARQAVEGGSAQGQLLYGRILGLRGDFAKCEEVFGVGAANDVGPALYWLARYRLRRSNTRRAWAEVRPLLERAAAKGSIAAHRVLGSAMARGRFGLGEIPQGIRIVAEISDRMSAQKSGDKTDLAVRAAPGAVKRMSVFRSSILAFLMPNAY